MLKRHLNLILAVAAAMVLSITGCGKKSDSSTSGSTTPSTLSAFEVQITSVPETGGTSVLEADCTIPASAAYGTVSACTNPLGVVNTSVAIPEGRLYYSKLNFTINVGIGAATPTCARAVFTPYQYAASVGAAFNPPWAGGTPIVCNTPPLPVGCFGGIAQDIVPSYPKYAGVYFLVATGNTMTFTAQSANSHGYGSNRFSVNNLVVRGAAHTYTNSDAYLANSFIDYKFSCLDQWDQTVYGFTLTLTDQDITGIYPNGSMGNININQYPDWDPASWQF